MNTKLTKLLIEFSETELMKPISDKRRILEIVAVAITALGKFVFMDFLDWRLPFVLCAILGWSIYVYYRYKQDKNILKYYGFRKDNFKQTIKLMLPFGLLAITSFFIIGYYQDTINLSWHILPLLITYPIWGTIQQFLTIALIAGNLKDFKRVKINKTIIILLTALLFAVVHYPSLWLMIGTFLLALFYGNIYMKIKNVYAMGLFHGWLGALFYYTVLGLDPFKDIFLKYFS